MSSYASDTDLGNRLTQQKLIDLSDLQNTGSIDTDVTTAALSFSSALIDSYCAGRYQLPLQPSDQLVDFCVTIAVYKLYEGRQRKIPEPVVDAYKVALAFLKDVSAGKATLDQATVEQTSELNTVTRDHRRDPEVFDEHKLKAY